MGLKIDLGLSERIFFKEILKMKAKIFNASIVLDNGVLAEGTVVFLKRVKECPETDASYDAEGAYLLPGFIDIHCHGGGGYDFMDATPEEMRAISAFHLSHGPTTLVATTLTDTWENIEGALSRFAALENERATLHGVHLEGPWFAPSQCGAQKASDMEGASAKKLCELKTRYPFIERISLAPELDEGFAVAKAARTLGVIAAIGHTDASFDETIAAADNGYSLVTHVYSGMRGVVRKNAYREAGCVEGALYDDRLIVEVIADGKHLPAALLKLIYKCKGAERICLITDATRGAGAEEGAEVMLGRADCGTLAIVEDGVAKLPDRQAFAGSVATTDRLVRTVRELVGLPIWEISKMMSATPARVMGYTDRGSIKTGLRADLVLLNANYTVQKVFLNGEMK